MTDPERADARTMGALVRAGEVTPLELAEACIARIERVNPRINAISHRLYESGREQAVAMAGEGVFAGVPWLMKDLLILCAGVPTTNAIPALRDFVAPHDSHVVTSVKAAGFNPIAKTTTPENGYCFSSESRMWGATRNPWDLGRAAGGSSGGAAAAVAARIMPIAHASDGGGSIRVPASFCGLFGFKPSRGRVSYGPDYVDFWYGGAVEGCIATNVGDAAAYYQAIFRSRPGEPYAPPALAQPLDQIILAPPPRLRIGVIETGTSANLAPDCTQALTRAVALCESLGHRMERASLPGEAAEIFDTFNRVAAVAAAAGRTAIGGLIGRTLTEQDLSRANWQLCERGSAISGVAHLADIEAFRRLGVAVAEACEPFDVVLMPTVGQLPPPIGYLDMYGLDLDPYVERLRPFADFSLPFNLSGQPAMTVPLHLGSSGLPVGVQFVAAHGADGLLLQMAAELEATDAWVDRTPPVCALT